MAERLNEEVGKFEISYFRSRTAGLKVANRLLDKRIDTFTVLEQEKSAGGLCRSEKVDGKPLNLGGIS